MEDYPFSPILESRADSISGQVFKHTQLGSDTSSPSADMINTNTHYTPSVLTDPYMPSDYDCYLRSENWATSMDWPTLQYGTGHYVGLYVGTDTADPFSFSLTEMKHSPVMINASQDPCDERPNFDSDSFSPALSITPSLRLSDGREQLTSMSASTPSLLLSDSGEQLPPWSPQWEFPGMIPSAAAILPNLWPTTTVMEAALEYEDATQANLAPGTRSTKKRTVKKAQSALRRRQPPPAPSPQKLRMSERAWTAKLSRRRRRPLNGGCPSFCSVKSWLFTDDEEHQAAHCSHVLLTEEGILGNAVIGARFFCKWVCCTSAPEIGYSDLNGLKRHMKSKHCSIPTTCGYCESDFSRPDVLIRHIRGQHPDVHE